MREFLFRLTMIFTNIFFPPFAVAMLSGLSMDLVMNCLLLFLAIIPSHIHGFYISCIYFHRRNKVRKGKYPGGPKPFVYSNQIINGGFSNATVEMLKNEKLSRRTSRRSYAGYDDHGEKDLNRRTSRRIDSRRASQRQSYRSQAESGHAVEEIRVTL